MSRATVAKSGRRCKASLKIYTLLTDSWTDRFRLWAKQWTYSTFVYNASIRGWTPDCPHCHRPMTVDKFFYLAGWPFPILDQPHKTHSLDLIVVKVTIIVCKAYPDASLRSAINTISQFFVNCNAPVRPLFVMVVMQTIHSLSLLSLHSHEEVEQTWTL